MKLLSKENSRKCTLNTYFKISRKPLCSWNVPKNCFHKNDAGSLKFIVAFSVGGFKGYSSGL